MLPKEAAELEREFSEKLKSFGEILRKAVPKGSAVRKKELADKLMSTKEIPGLTMLERDEICYYLTTESLPPQKKRGAKGKKDRDELAAFWNSYFRLESGRQNLELADPDIGTDHGKLKMFQRGEESIKQWASEMLIELTEASDRLQKLQQQYTSPPGTGLIHSKYLELLEVVADKQKYYQKHKAICSGLIRLMETNKKNSAVS